MAIDLDFADEAIYFEPPWVFQVRWQTIPDKNFKKKHKLYAQKHRYLQLTQQGNTRFMDSKIERAVTRNSDIGRILAEVSISNANFYMTFLMKAKRKYRSVLQVAMRDLRNILKPASVSLQETGDLLSDSSAEKRFLSC